MLDYKLYTSILKGLITYIPYVSGYIDNKKESSKHSGSNAYFSYSLWLSILVYLNENETKASLEKVGEVGNGGSFGAGFCSLLSGSKEYYSFEIMGFVDFQNQITLLNDVYELFKRKAPIRKYSNLNIQIKSYDYPDALITISEKRQETVYLELLEELTNKMIHSKYIRIVPNWEKVDSKQLSFVFSRAVMEHVNNPEQVYFAIYRHLKNESFHLHDIEFHSHGITKSITGHYKISEFLWQIITGRRKFFLNRWSLFDHLSSINKNGFEVINSQSNFKNLNQTEELFGGVILALKNE